MFKVVIALWLFPTIFCPEWKLKRNYLPFTRVNIVNLVISNHSKITKNTPLFHRIALLKCLNFAFPSYHSKSIRFSGNIWFTVTQKGITSLISLRGSFMVEWRLWETQVFSEDLAIIKTLEHLINLESEIMTCLYHRRNLHSCTSIFQIVRFLSVTDT